MAFRGKVTFFTGGGSGMGRLAAQRLAHGGVRVAAVDINETGLAETTKGEAAIRSFVLDVAEARRSRRRLLGSNPSSAPSIAC